MNKEER